MIQEQRHRTYGRSLNVPLAVFSNLKVLAAPIGALPFGLVNVSGCPDWRTEMLWLPRLAHELSFDVSAWLPLLAHVPVGRPARGRPVATAPIGARD